MIKQTVTAAAISAALLLSTPAAAQSQQEQIGTRYDLALAAGYKALFLCSAMANAERAGTTRTPESVLAWELSGIQAPLNDLVQDMPHRITRTRSIGEGEQGQISHVSVAWEEDMRPRIAVHDSQQGCSILPIGGGVSPIKSLRQYDPANAEQENLGDGALVAAAFGADYGQGTRSTAALVMRDGEIISEQYAEGFTYLTPQRTWSVAKSIAATLVGAAVESGEANVRHRAGLGNFIPDQTRHKITIDHLLRMASGRYSDTPGNRTDPIYWGGATVNERAAGWPVLHEPGTVYRYANNDTLMAVRAIGGYLEQNPPADLFAKLGMTHTVAERDWDGSYVLSSQVWSTARDLAQLGQLYLNNGEWEGERILPEYWREYVSSPLGPQPEGRPVGYGAGFWLINQTEGVPADTFAAFGNRGQYVVIVPSRDIVIVRRGEDPVGSRFDIASFTRDILAELDD